VELNEEKRCLLLGWLVYWVLMIVIGDEEEKKMGKTGFVLPIDDELSQSLKDHTNKSHSKRS